MVLRRQKLGFWTCQGGAVGSFQMETLKGSTLGLGGRWVKAAETEASKDSQPPVTQSPTELRAVTLLWVCVRGNSEGRQHHPEPLRFFIHNVQHSTKKTKTGVTTNRTKRKKNRNRNRSGGEPYTPVIRCKLQLFKNILDKRKIVQESKRILEIENNSD